MQTRAHHESRQPARTPALPRALETDCLWRGTAHVAAVQVGDDEADRDLAGPIALNAALAASGLARAAMKLPSPASHPHAVAAAGRRGVAVVHRDPDRRVGVHLAPLGSLPPRLAGCFTTSEERRRCPFADPTVLWTLKEAAWQAIGIEGLAFRELAIAFTCHGHIRAVRSRGHETPAHAVVLLPWPGWILSAVCLEDAA